MRAARIVAVTIAVSISLWYGVPQSQAQAVDPLFGTWTLDVAKSKFSPGPGPKSIILAFSETAEGVKTVTDLVLPDGQAVHQETTVRPDGKDYPVTGSPGVDTTSMTRKGNVVSQVNKKDGTVVVTFDGVLSKDGKTFTVQMKGINAQEGPVNNSLVYVKAM